MSTLFYVAACAATLQGGIHLVELDADGRLKPLDFIRVQSPNYLAFSPDRKTLYATCAQGKEEGVAAFRVGKSGRLEALNFVSGRAKTPCHLTVDPSGKYLFTANYSSGDISIFALAADGSVSSHLRNIAYQGRGTDPKRQGSPHPHCTRITPDKKFLAVVDLGTDQISLHRLDPAAGIEDRIARQFSATAGSGPRHMEFSPDGRFAYIVTELGNTVISCAYRDGQLTGTAEISTLPDQFSGKSYAGAVIISKDGRYVIVSNRGYDSTAVFSRNADGSLVAASRSLAGGKYPRDIALIGGRKLLTANELSDNVYSFDYDATRGLSTPDGQALTFKRPLAILQIQ